MTAITMKAVKVKVLAAAALSQIRAQRRASRRAWDDAMAYHTSLPWWRRFLRKPPAMPPPLFLVAEAASQRVLADAKTHPGALVTISVHDLICILQHLPPDSGS